MSACHDNKVCDIKIGGLVWSLRDNSGEVQDYVMKAVAFHASLSATWVDANGSKWEYEFWFGNNTMNPAVERCWLKTWREQVFLVHEEPNLCNLKSSPKELMRVLLDEAVKFQSYHRRIETVSSTLPMWPQGLAHIPRP